MWGGSGGVLVLWECLLVADQQIRQYKQFQFSPCVVRMIEHYVVNNIMWYLCTCPPGLSQCHDSHCQLSVHTLNMVHVY